MNRASGESQLGGGSPLMLILAELALRRPARQLLRQS
jgi:hypothetical protein